jgi:hypothetical protein
MNRSRLLAGFLALALAAPALGADEPGVFKIPGTESTIKFYGYIQLDSTLDFSGRPNDYEDNDWATILPAVPANDSFIAKHKKPQLYWTARQSRFGLTTSTPSDYGPITVKLEGDFNAPNAFQGETYTNSVIFRLRQAYGQFGGLLVGQTWSTFLDLGAYPDVVDFNGPGTIALVRNPMVRYTFGLAPGATLALAAENHPASRFGGPNFQTVPDLIAALTFTGGWGHINARGVFQQYNVAQQATVPAPGGGTQTVFLDQDAKTVQGYGFGVSGDFKIGGDTLVLQFVGGPGIGRYIFNAAGEPFFFTKNLAGDLDTFTMYGVHAGFTHVWNKAFRSNLVGSYSWFVDPKIGGVETPAGAISQTDGVTGVNQKDYIQAFLNTFWSFSKTAELGVEYAFGQWRSFTGGGTSEIRGTENRVNVSVHYNFY